MDSDDSTATAVKVAIAVVAPLASGLAVLGGIGSFATVRHLADPWFGHQSWIVPVGIDIGILALLAWDLLDEYLGLPWPPLRWTAWAFIAATVYLNVTAARGNLAAAVMHAAMPVLFVTVIEGIRHLIRQRAGLASGTRTERIPAARWLLAPRSSFLLLRHMVLWHVTSYQQGLALEHQRLTAVARLQQTHGHFLWRWRAPLSDRLALRAAPVSGLAGTTPAVAANWAAPALKARPAGDVIRNLLPRRCLLEPPVTSPPGLNDRDTRLVQAAAAMLRDANEHGVPLSQAALGRKLRGLGIPVANDRLRWLIATASKWPRPA